MGKLTKLIFIVFTLILFLTVIGEKANATWTIMNEGRAVWDVWGSSATDVFAVGKFGTILHYDGNPGGNWSDMEHGGH